MSEQVTKMLRTPRGTRYVQCAWRYCPTRQRMVLVRLDTSKVVASRDAEEHERQPCLWPEFCEDDDSGHVPGPVRVKGVL